jgi:hypothetical protein
MVMGAAVTLGGSLGFTVVADIRSRWIAVGVTLVGCVLGYFGMSEKDSGA